ncbi:MAG: hypothetical protein KDB95_04135 [Flavobacteriales bacterium]|nr:hypothetical protein [Flavobacteriales bacterium]
MKKTINILLLSIPIGLLTSCASMQQSTSVADDVYFLPSQAPVMASTDRTIPVEEPVKRAPVQDDYYDAGTSNTIGTDRDYYDLAYNDPYYYNYGRFGFNAAPMGWQTGWNGPGWGGGMSLGFGYGWGNGWNMGFGLGYGSGIYSGWYRPMWYTDPFYWNTPWAWRSPWGWGSPWYNSWGYGAGWGYGNYYGPWGNCYGCYAPIIIGDGVANSTVIGHRNSVGSRNSLGSSASGTHRGVVRNPVGLAPAPSRNGITNAPVRQQPSSPERRQPVTVPGRDRNVTPSRERTREVPSPSRNVERSAPSRNHDFGGGGGRTSPSRDTGGGGGGGRTSPGRR